MATNIPELKEIVTRLDILIALALTSSSVANEVSVTAKVKALAGLGLSPAEVGRILRRPTNYVSAVLGTKRLRKTQ